MNEEKIINEKYIIHLTDEEYRMAIEKAQNDISRKWVQKVKDKIEKLKKKRMKKYDDYMGYKIESREQQDIDKKINVLQELIEESEEKRC